MSSEQERVRRARDVTEELTETRERLCAAISGNEALLHTLNLHSNVSIMDSAGKIIDVNDNFCRVSGYSRDELLGQPHNIVYSGAQDDEVWAERWRKINAGESWRGEICNRTKDGALFWMDSMIAPILGEDGHPALYIAIRNDISLAKETELKLRATEAFLDRTGQTAGVGGWEFDVRSHAVRWSAQMMRIHEVDLSYQPVLREALRFHPPEARAKLKAALRRGMKHGKGWDLELPLVTALGRTIWVRTVGEAEFVDERPVRFVGSMQDITARKQTESALAQERARMDQLVTQLQEANSRFAIASESAAIAIWEFDPLSRRLLWDDRMYLIYGIKPPAGAATFKQWEDALHPEDRGRCVIEIDEALSTKRDLNTEFRIVRPGGEIRYVKATARVAGDGTALRMMGVNIDISEAKRAQLQLFKTSSMLRTVLDSAAEISIIATAPDLTVKVFNAGAERLLGYTSKQVVDSCTPVLVHDRDELQQLCDDVGNQLGRHFVDWEVYVQPSMRDLPHECTFVRQDGQRLRVSQVVTAMHTYEGELLGYLSVAHDVTVQRQYEQSLREATSRAEQANRAKSDFLANMSHEIRTPMNAVVGLSYLLGRTSLGKEQAALLGNLQTASKSLLAIINDVLDLSKIEAGELMVEKTPFSPRSLIEELVAVMRLHADNKGIAFGVEMPDDLPGLLIGDPTRLNQILTNLLSNAMRFTDRGKVELKVIAGKDSGHGVSLSFSVKDTGIGISEEAQARLFSPFAQADASITRRYGGTGLGLSIVKSIVGVLGGSLSLDSTPGLGSKFTVELCFPQALGDARVLDLPIVGATGTFRLAGVRILVADDSDINLDVVKSVLELEGAHVSLARNGQEAFDRLQADACQFDVVLMDVQMPVMGGHDAALLIRSELGLVDLPIIALTAGALSSARDRSIAAGMDDFLIKPFDPITLIRCISKHVRVSNDRAATPISASAVATAPPVAWPDIEGIDSAEARARLSNDARLFLSCVARLLVEFSEVSFFSEGQEASLPKQAARMHKLKGAAGMLGAKGICALAAETEAACVAGDAQRASDFAAALATGLRQLRESAAPVVNAARAGAETLVEPLGSPLEPYLVDELVQLLRQQNLSAVDRFRTLEPRLRRHLAAAVQGELRSHMEALRFEAAAEMLQSNYKRA
jgi:PAS domain S-box-containing protein